MIKTDEQLKKDIIDQLYWDARIDASDITVEVNNSTVTLRGTVPTYLCATAAYSDAADVLGVAAVKNEIQVTYPETFELPTDEEIEARLIERLAANPDINVMDLEVLAVAGTVKLTGTVDAYWKKFHAEKICALESGVVQIENHLTVVPTEKIIDKDIARDIMTTLELKADVEADDVNVEVSDGHVLLNGTLPTWTARQAAHDAALYTPGVTTVENRLFVAP